MPQNSDEKRTTHAARRVCELFRGRFSEAVGKKLIEDRGGELEAVEFILNGPASDVSEYLNENPDYVEEIRRDSEKIANLLENGIEYEIRQFACETCVSAWWKKVPCRKQVSKCKRCNVKYDPVPQEKEWGWAKFVCTCSNVFHAFGEKGVTISECYKCGSSVPVDCVLPPRRRIGSTRKSRKPHSCNGVNCFNRHDGYINNAMATLSMSSQNSHHASHHNNITYNVMPGDGGNPRQPNGTNGVKSDTSGNATSGDTGDASNGTGAYPPEQRKGVTPVCIHPMSQKAGRRIITPSQRHRSTGSTVQTFLSQGSLNTDAVSVAFTLDSIREV